MNDNLSPSQNGPKFSALASAAWAAVVLWVSVSFVDLPGDPTTAAAAEVALVAAVVALPAWLVGRFVQKRWTDPKEPPDLEGDDGLPHGDPDA